MSDFTEADVDLGVAALWAKQYPYSADLVDCVLTAVAPAMRDRWQAEALRKAADEAPTVDLTWASIRKWLRARANGIESGGEACSHDSHYVGEDDGHSHWRCMRCGQVTECQRSGGDQ